MKTRYLTTKEKSSLQKLPKILKTMSVEELYRLKDIVNLNNYNRAVIPYIEAEIRKHNEKLHKLIKKLGLTYYV